jgi:kinesin family member 11
MLVETGTREDVPTGTTPRKRQWDFNDHWERTKPREAVLREWRQRNGSSSSSLHRSSGLGESHHVEEYIPPPPENEEHLPQETPSEPEQTNSSSDGEETVAPDEESGPETTSEETKVKPVQTRSKAMIASGLPAPRASMLPPTLKRPLGSGLPKSSALADRLANVPATRRRLR